MKRNSGTGALFLSMVLSGFSAEVDAGGAQVGFAAFALAQRLTTSKLVLARAPGKVVVRGGSWYDRPTRCRSAFRQVYPPDQVVYDVGFRVICNGRD